MTTDEALKAYGRIVDGLESELAAKDADLKGARVVLTAYDELVDSLRAEIAAKDAQVATAMETADRAFASASAAKDAEIAALKEALMTFATFGLVDPSDASGVDMLDGLMRDRICDWFGPSDFRAARAALEMRGGVK
jgi:hypothetical protein